MFSHRDSEIISPEGESNALILVITPSEATSDTLKEILIDRKYSIAGPFKSVDRGNTFVRKYSVDAIIFDYNTSSSEIDSMVDLLKQDINDVPLILLSNTKVSFDYNNIHLLISPIKSDELALLLIEELKGGLENISSNEKFIEFINKIISKIIELTPENYKQSVVFLLKDGIQRFVHRNSDSIKISTDNLSFIITDELFFDYKNLTAFFHFTMNEIIDEINEKENISWARSLFIDSIENLLLREKINLEILFLIKEFGIDVEKFGESVVAIIPNIEEMEKDSVVFSISLTDLGPELLYKIGDESLLDLINDRIASQILTLVGQGSEYHEGIFGPIPIPSSMDLTALICSRKMGSPIRDERMRGKSLNVLAIGFRRKILNCLPEREIISEIFMDFNKIENESDINTALLQNIQNKFSDSLNC